VDLQKIQNDCAGLRFLHWYSRSVDLQKIQNDCVVAGEIAFSAIVFAPCRPSEKNEKVHQSHLIYKAKFDNIERRRRKNRVFDIKK